jgi:hypothetical protein
MRSSVSKCHAKFRNAPQAFSSVFEPNMACRRYKSSRIVCKLDQNAPHLERVNRKGCELGVLLEADPISRRPPPSVLLALSSEDQVNLLRNFWNSQACLAHTAGVSAFPPIRASVPDCLACRAPMSQLGKWPNRAQLRGVNRASCTDLSPATILPKLYNVLGFERSIQRLYFSAASFDRSNFTVRCFPPVWRRFPSDRYFQVSSNRIRPKCSGGPSNCCRRICI